ncbi:MAG: S-layer homology domain-containing protein [Clostridiales bacterium]|nr:S-layer homology domain-containing protein [Clostridiales bacterium]
MNFYKCFALKTAAIAGVLTLSFSGAAFAMSYSDIPANHWAYAAIDEVSNRGILVGDLNGNFKPDDFIDKFETAKILAKMAGYQYADISAEEQLYYDRCYENNKAFINQFSAKFSKWNATYNKEIAFLLEKEILTQSDLDQFVIVVNNEERLRALSREEACLYLTKVMGKGKEAAAVKPSAPFADDASIAASHKNYVYYFRQLGIVKGDNNNNFNPKGATTKAAMAVIIQAVYKNMGGAAPIPGTQPPQSAAMETVQGSVAKLFPTARAIQVSSANEKYNNKIYIVSSTATVNVNGFVKTYADLTEGMSFTGVFSGNELISITTSGQVPANTPTPTSPPNGTSVTTPPANQTLLEGTIAGVNAANKTIEFETRSLSPRGEISSDVRTYTVAADAVITRSGAAATMASIVRGDIAAMSVSGAAVSRIELQDKNIAFSGVLTEKSFHLASGIPFLVVTDEDGTLYKFTLTNTTVITRKGVASAAWSDLRTGDAVDIVAEYETLKSIHATGVKSSVDAWVKDIFISGEVSKVTATDANNRDKIYPLINGVVDPYALRVGSKVRFRLDSAEVESFTILEDSQALSLSGKITKVSKSTVSLSSSSSPRTFKIDSKTVIVDSRTGKTVSESYLDEGMSIYVVFGETSGDYAKTITILGY